MHVANKGRWLYINEVTYTRIRGWYISGMKHAHAVTGRTAENIFLNEKSVVGKERSINNNYLLTKENNNTITRQFCSCLEVKPK